MPHAICNRHTAEIDADRVVGKYLKKLSEGLNEGEVQVLGEAPNIMVGLDGVAVLLATAWRGAGLYNIRVQGSLQQD